MTKIEISGYHIKYMTDWASTDGAMLQTRGWVGFDRECVGIEKDSNYVEYSDSDNIWTPVDAYHKFNCLAVLVHGNDYDTALHQLYEWVKWLKEHGWTITHENRRATNVIDAMLHGWNKYKIVGGVGL